MNCRQATWAWRPLENGCCTSWNRTDIRNIEPGERPKQMQSVRRTWLLSRLCRTARSTKHYVATWLHLLSMFVALSSRCLHQIWHRMQSFASEFGLCCFICCPQRLSRSEMSVWQIWSRSTWVPASRPHDSHILTHTLVQPDIHQTKAEKDEIPYLPRTFKSIDQRTEHWKIRPEGSRYRKLLSRRVDSSFHLMSGSSCSLFRPLRLRNGCLNLRRRKKRVRQSSWRSPGWVYTTVGLSLGIQSQCISWLDVVSNESSWASCSACWLEFWILGVLRRPVFWSCWSSLFEFLAMASRPRSRSRERLLSMAVMSELHRLPQSERQLIQKLKTTISEIQELTKLSGFTRVMSDIAQHALDLPTPDGQSSAFILKGELQQISNQIVELNDSLNATMHGHLEDMEASFKSLTTTPDGSPFNMFSRAVDFTSRQGFFFLKKKGGKGRFLSLPGQAARWSWFWVYSQFSRCSFLVTLHLMFVSST